MNLIELLPCENGVTAVLTAEDGTITFQLLSWEEFLRLQAAIEGREKQPS